MKEEIRDSFVAELTELRKENHTINVLVSDSTSTCRIGPFVKKYPDSLVNVGIAEQNLVGVAAGLALSGLTAITANATPFLFGRSNEQVKVDVCYSNTNVKLVGLNPGFAYGSLGPTHHCIDDVATTMAFEHIEILCPCDPEETRQITKYAVEKEGPVYIRLDSFQAENVHAPDYKFVPGEPVILQEGKDITLVALGTIVHEVLAAAKELADQGISAEVVSVPSIRPLNPAKLVKSMKKTGKVITVEEHSLHGGIGAIVADMILSQKLGVAFDKIGVPTGNFAPASPRKDIQAGYELDAAGVVKRAKALCAQ